MWYVALVVMLHLFATLGCASPPTPEQFKWIGEGDARIEKRRGRPAIVGAAAR